LVYFFFFAAGFFAAGFLAADFLAAIVSHPPSTRAGARGDGSRKL
jgi:hypothetical protein